MQIFLKNFNFPLKKIKSPRKFRGFFKNFLHLNIRKIFNNSIIFINMNRVFYCQKPNHGRISPTRRNIRSDIFMNKTLIKRENFIEIFPFQKLTRNRHARRRCDRHISVKWKFFQNIILDFYINLHHITAHAIHLTIVKRRIFHHIFVRRIVRIRHDKISRIRHNIASQLRNKAQKNYKPFALEWAKEVASVKYCKLIVKWNNKFTTNPCASYGTR